MAQGLSRRGFAGFVVAMVAAGGAKPAFARGATVYTGRFSTLAAGGADVLAYFTEGKHVEGLAALSHTWNGATWRFANAANRERFQADPERFAPAYGGHCAWAIAQGYRAAGDPRHWSIVEGRLFLNYNATVHQSWLVDRDGFIARADRRWPNV